MPSMLFRLALLTQLTVCGSALGNTGVFLGSGHTLRLIKSADVQMISEDVAITPICGVSAMDHSVDFRCTFVLKNVSAKPLKIQVGFPVDREWHGAPPPPSDGTNEVLSYHFIARDTNNTYHLRYMPSDQQRKYARIFLWDMEFAAAETKTLRVGYVLPMSFAASTTRKTAGLDTAAHTVQYEKPWHVRTEGCVVVSFSYVTETGQSWAGPIHKATFRFSNKAFEHCLRKFPEYMGGNPAELPPGTKIPNEDASAGSVGSIAELGFIFGLKLGAVYPCISPGGWESAYVPDILGDQPRPQYEPDGIVWKFENYHPGPPLSFAYYLLGFPETAADCEQWVRQVLGKTPARRDVLELREIVAAFFGIAPQTGSVRRLVEQQIWWRPQSKLKQSNLNEVQRAVLDRLDMIANDCSGPTER